MKTAIAVSLTCVVFVCLATLLLPREKQATVRRVIPFGRAAVWQMAFAVERQAEWRSDVQSVALVRHGEPRIWREQLTFGGAVTLRDYSIEPENRWTIESVENPHLASRWTGEFRPRGEAQTEVVFTEHFRALSLKGKLLLFLFIHPEKLMQTYADDLQQALSKKPD